MSRRSTCHSGRMFWAAVFALALATVCTTGASAGGNLTGAGSTWVYPLVAKWSAAYQKLTGTEVNYQSIGSGGGIAQIKAGTVAFGASDMPLKPEDLKAAGLIQFPTAVAGEDLVYNLPGISAEQIVLSGPLVADIISLRLRSGTTQLLPSSTQASSCPTWTSPSCMV